jgi:N-acetylglutamate synthase-like GNAT family acetyltransferase
MPPLPQITIRPTIVADIHAGLYDCLACLVTSRGMPPLSVAEARLYDRLSKVTMLSAVHRSRVIGTASLLVEQKVWGNAGYLEDVAVVEESRTVGVGTALVKEVIARSRSAGCYRLVLRCADDKVGFYARCGFAPYSGKTMRLDDV